MYSPPQFSSPGYTQVRYTTTPVTPATGPTAYRNPYSTSPSKDPYRAHRRHASHGPTTTSAYPFTAQAQAAAYYASPGYPPGGYYTPTFSPPKQPEFVSSKDHVLNKAKRAAQQDGSKQRGSPSAKHGTYVKTKEYYSSKHDAGRQPDHEDEGYYSGNTPPPQYIYNDYTSPGTDSYGRSQVAGQKRSADSSKNKTSSRPRAASFSATQQKPSSSRPRASSKVKSPPKATPADAHRAHIPAGFSIKNWDPTEEPILLLGSVFDANSLGKWIYDWTVYRMGAATPLSDLAGDLWLLLIQLAGKIKRAEECLERIRHPDDRDLVEDFLESGERLWARFSKILKSCEEYMWRAANKEAKKKGTNASASMGAKSGCEFVDSIFGRDRKLEDTEKLMTGMRLWSMRFDANCEDILRNPRA